jgi:1,4-alpha-glucan branching enzyme
VAANRGAPPPEGELRSIAEARCRFVAGVTLLSAGTPMFLMGEEIGATKDFTYGDFLDHREDLHGERKGKGRFLFRFYADLIRLRRRHHALTSPNIAITHLHNADRVLAFHRWRGPEHYIVVSTLSDHGYSDGYKVRVPNDAHGNWREIFTSDATVFGGGGVSNESNIPSSEGSIVVRVPARGFVVLRHMPA